jgi:hypothetical protein
LDKMTAVGHARIAGLRRALGLVLIGGLCAAAVTFYREGPELPRSASTPAGGAPSAAGSASPANAPSASSTTSPVWTVPTTPPKEVKLPKGPGTTKPGILLMASPLPGGSFDIAEIVRLPEATSSLRLGPPILSLAGNRFAKSKPVATQVQVSAEDQPVRVPDGRVSRQMGLALTNPSKSIELRYHLGGVTIRSIPSPAGRALTAIGPLIRDVPKSTPVAMMVSGNTVLNIECPAVRSVSKQACWIGRRPQFRVKPQLTRDRAVIVVQFDLPRPQ